MARDDGARVGRAPVEPDAEPGGATIGRNPSVIGHEVVFRVFGGDAALQRMAVQPDFLLRGNAGALGVTDARSLGDEELGAHDVDASDLLGHRVFDLDTGVDLDEMEFAAVSVHQELDGTSVHIAGVPRQLERRSADVGALLLVEVRRRGALHDLLVAALDRTIALEQVDQVSMAVAQDLDLDMARPGHKLLQVNFAIAKSRHRLAPPLIDLVEKA